MRRNEKRNALGDSQGAPRDSTSQTFLCDFDSVEGVFRRAIAASIPTRLITIDHPSWI
jgi:hypothetical protein